MVLEAARPLAHGARLSLDGIDTITVGRGPSRTFARSRDGTSRLLSVTLPSPSLSSQHARFRRAGSQWEVEDLGARNGTYVRGERVRRVTLAEGELVELGRAFLSIRTHCNVGAAAPPPEMDDDSPGRRPEGLRTVLPWLGARNDDLLRVAATQIPILFIGDTGTGKELAARAVHVASGRQGAFVPVNCGALPETLVEGLLFGHTKGSFSGAWRDELGFIRSADRGTLFLDEVGDLPLPAQAALLRVLQEGEVVPVGSTRARKVDLRIVSATHRRIDSLAAGETFRRDLFARLKGYLHELPRLVDRREDLGTIVGDLLARRPDGSAIVTLTGDAARAVLAYPWPLNVRELQQALEAALALARDGVITASGLPHEVLRGAVAPPPAPDPVDLEAMLRALLTEHEGNVAGVARAMGKMPFQVYRWMRRFGIDAGTFRRAR